MKLIEKIKDKYFDIVKTLDKDLIMFFKMNYIKILFFMFALLIVNVILVRSSTINSLIIPATLLLLLMNTIIVIYTAKSNVYILYGTVIKVTDDDDTYEILSKRNRKKEIFKIYVKSDYNDFYYIIKVPFLKMAQYQKGSKIKCFFHEDCLYPVNDNTAKITKYLHILSTKTTVDNNQMSN